MKYQMKIVILICFIAAIFCFRISRNKGLKDINTIKKETEAKVKKSASLLPNVKITNADWFLFNFHESGDFVSEFKCWEEKTKLKDAEKKVLGNNLKTTLNKLKELHSKNKLTKTMLDGHENKKQDDDVKHFAKELLDIIKPFESKIKEFEKSNGVNCYKRGPKRLFIQKSKSKVKEPSRGRKIAKLLLTSALELTAAGATYYEFFHDDSSEHSPAEQVAAYSAIPLLLYQVYENLSEAYYLPPDQAVPELPDLELGQSVSRISNGSVNH